MIKNNHVQLVEDMQAYLRALSRIRDSEKLRSLLGQSTFAEALDIALQPCSAVLARLCKGNALSGLLEALQPALKHLIDTIAALRTRIQYVLIVLASHL